MNDDALSCSYEARIRRAQRKLTQLSISLVLASRENGNTALLNETMRSLEMAAEGLDRAWHQMTGRNADGTMDGSGD